MRQYEGFTFLELIAAFTIAVILLLIAIPLSYQLVTDNRAQAQINQLLAAINYARNEAIQMNQRVTFCGSTYHKLCDGNWQQGQLVITENKQLLRVFSALSKQDKLVWNSSGTHRDSYLTFQPSGFTYGQQGRFYLCSGNRNYHNSYAIVVNNSGRLRVDSVTANDYVEFCLN